MKKKSLTYILNKGLALSLVLAMAIGLSACGKKEAVDLDLPKADQVESITVKHAQSPEDSEGFALTQDPSPIIDLLTKEARLTKKESVNDQPTNIDDYMVLEFQENPAQANPKRVYIYESQGKYHLEQAYQGIWEINQEAYEKVLDIIEKEAKITPAN